MSYSEFEASFLLIMLIIIMLYSNHKYPQNYILNGLWILMISAYGVSTMNENYLFTLTLIIFNIIINITYLSFNLEKRK